MSKKMKFPVRIRGESNPIRQIQMAELNTVAKLARNDGFPFPSLELKRSR